MAKMISKKRMNYFLLAFCIVMFFVTSLFGGALIGQIANAEVIYNLPQLESEYVLDTVFTIPDVMIDVDGESYQAKGSLKFPNEKVYGNKSIVLSEEGTYVLNYSAVIDGKLYQKDMSFEVVSDVKGLFDMTKNVEMQYGESTFWTENNVSGLQVKMAGSDTLTYNRAINVKSLAKEDVLLDLAAVPSAAGVQDFSEFVIKFMDAENEDVYFTVRVYDHFNGAGDHNGAYALSCWQGVDNSPYSGPPMKFSFAGLNEFRNIRFYYDPETYTMWASVSFYFGKEVMVADFSNKVEWTNVENMKISISVGGVSSKANFYISSIGGVDFSQKAVEDVMAPKLFVNDISDKVVAEVGTPFKVFGSFVTDNYTAIKTWVTATYSIGGSEMQIDQNGYFTPDKAGFCYINYFAEDSMGNLSEQHIKIAVKPQLDPLEISVEDDGVDAYLVGQRISVRNYACVGGAGNNVESGLVTNMTNNKTYNLDSGKFFTPQEAGTYVITYKVVDYLGNEDEISYSVEVTKPDKIFVANELVLPPMFINGMVYDLTGITGYDYSKNAEVNPKIYVKANGVEKEIPNGIFTPTNYADGSQLEIIYKFGEGATSVVKSQTRVVRTIKQGFDFMQNYFVGENIQTSATSKNVVIKTQKDDTSITFANKLAADVLSLSLGVQSQGDLIIKLYDSKNSSQVVEVKIGSDNIVTVNQKNRYTFDYKIADSNEKKFHFNLKNNTFTGCFAGIVDTFLDGTPFTGFDSDYIYCSFEVKKQSTLFVYSINNQVFSTSSIDTSAPIINVSATNGGIVMLGETTTIHAGSAYDILNDVVAFSVTIANMNGDVCKSVDGKEMASQPATADYVIKFAAAGDYIATFYARDSAGRSTTVVKNFRVVNTSAKPNIQLKNNYAVEYSIGETITIIDASIPNNAQLYVFVQKQNGHNTGVAVGNTFTLSEKGTYRVVYFVVDEQENVNYLEVSILVR